MCRGSTVLKNRSDQELGRIVSIDYGSQRVGLSLADPLGLFAQPFLTCSPKTAIKKLVSLHACKRVRVIVIGWPLEEDGSEGTSTRNVDRYIRQLCSKLPGIEIIRWDERYTSEEAKTRLVGRHSDRKAGAVDQVAACIILQEYLDSISETQG